MAVRQATGRGSRKAPFLSICQASHRRANAGSGGRAPH